MKYIGGFLMALADSVPGVSGGTILFLLGIYEEFIKSINTLITGSLQEKKKALFFLIKLACGWIVGFLLAVLILTSLFKAHIYSVSSLFIGFILFSIPLICSEEKDTIKGNYHHIVFTLIGITIVTAITYFNPGKSAGGNPMEFSFMNAIFVFFAGMIAISAMVLPGISGSTILLILGLYMPVMDAIHDLINFQFDALPIIIFFGLGIIAGVLITIRVIKWAFEKFRSQTIYLILGLMLGSLYSIVMGPTTLVEKNPIPKPLSVSTFSIVFFLIGGVVIGGLQLLKRLRPEEASDSR